MSLLTDIDNPILLKAIAIAHEAGALLSQKPVDLEVESKSSRTDSVTVMDKKAEQLIVSSLISAFPEDGILGEEGTDRPSMSGNQWIIDPLDGTVNYTYDLPLWSISIALVEQESQVGLIGVVHIPRLNQTFFAARGEGAFLLSPESLHQIHSSSVDDLELTLLGTGFGYSDIRRRGQARVISALIPQVRDIRRGGSCAIDLCWVASGVLDAYFERGVNPWDHAGGGLIAREAGAIVSGLHHNRESSAMIVAAGSGIHGQLTAILEELDADTDPEI